MRKDAGRPVAIVTGGGSGIGAATAERLASAGYDVAVSYRGNADGASRTVERCLAVGADALMVRGDIASFDDCLAVAAAACDRWGRVDVLVNNAGVTVNADAEDLDALQADDFAIIFGTNVTGTYQMTRAAWPHLRRSSAGAIVNVSSSGSHTGLGSSLAYAASKGAINNLTLGLARALAPSVRVNAVCPGVVDTEWRLNWQTPEEYNAFKQETIRQAPLKRVASAGEVADAILWFAAFGPSVTGQLLTIDGGINLRLGTQ